MGKKGKGTKPKPGDQSDAGPSSEQQHPPPAQPQQIPPQVPPQQIRPQLPPQQLQQQPSAWGQPQQQPSAWGQPQQQPYGRGHFQQPPGYGQQAQSFGQPRQPYGRGQPQQPPERGQSQQPPVYGQPRQPYGRGQPQQPPGYGQQEQAYGQPRQPYGRRQSQQSYGRGQPQQSYGRGQPQQPPGYGQPQQPYGPGQQQYIGQGQFSPPPGLEPYGRSPTHQSPRLQAGQEQFQQGQPRMPWRQQMLPEHELYGRGRSPLGQTRPVQQKGFDTSLEETQQTVQQPQWPFKEQPQEPKPEKSGEQQPEQQQQQSKKQKQKKQQQVEVGQPISQQQQQPQPGTSVQQGKKEKLKEQQPAVEPCAQGEPAPVKQQPTKKQKQKRQDTDQPAVQQQQVAEQLSPQQPQQPQAVPSAQQSKEQKQREQQPATEQHGEGASAPMKQQQTKKQKQKRPGEEQPAIQQQQPSPEQQQSKQKPMKQQQMPSPPVLSPQTSSSAGQSPDKRPAPISAETMELMELRRPEKRKPSKLGHEIKVETNHLALQVKPKSSTAIHYDVVITPNTPKRMLRRVWEDFMKDNYPNSPAAFDNVKNAYSPGFLPFGMEGSGEVSLMEDGEKKPRTFTICVKYAASINLTAINEYIKRGGVVEIPQDALQCIDVVLRNVAAARFCRVGRSFFSQPTGRIIKLGGGLELWHGHFQSAILGWKPFLNIDVAHKGFPSAQLVTDLIMEIANENDLNRVEFTISIEREIQKFLNGLKVMYQIPGQPEESRRSYRVNGLVQSPTQERFVDTQGRHMTIFEYYQNVRNYTIKYKHIPLLWVGSKNSKIYVPAELCTITQGQVINKKLNDKQTAQMVRSAATDTFVRKDKIMTALHKVNYNADACVKAFGLNVANNFEQLDARVLEPPNLQYKNQEVKPKKGCWRAPEFVEPKTLSKWTVLNLDRRTNDDSIGRFVNYFCRGAEEVGMVVESVTKPFRFLQPIRQWRVQLDKTFYELREMELVIVVVPDIPTDCYSCVKQIAELGSGCLTQCIKSKTMYNMKPATVGNILLKVNAKLNGKNHRIASSFRPFCLKEPCMIVGADVTHPSPDQTDIPSVAAVAASCDPTGFQYHFCWRLQPPKVEIIGDLKDIMVEQLQFFKNHCRQIPRKIIFFRDGVSEGQFSQVLNEEVQAIRNACASLGDGSYRPSITFLVVQKRHHTRFFPKNPRDSEDRNCNVPAGTLVDNTIVHPTAVEYYLVSHASIQGVARPTKYRMIWDDANMTDDEIQTLTYYLCHMFSRCSRSVSYPAPTYYAHLAAFRARVYLEGQGINLSNLDREQQTRIIHKKLSESKPMFFV